MSAIRANSSQISVQNNYKFPNNIQPLENQVAGHSFDDGNLTIGMLKDEDGFVFKPINKPEQGRREILFYETVNKSNKQFDTQLKSFIPEYFGCVSIMVNGKSTQFLKLSDAAKGFKKPCIMDVKMGKQTWEPGASLKKQESEGAKYTICKQQCGFCIPGFQVHNILNGSLDKYGKNYGKTLLKEDVPRVLKEYLNWKTGRSKAIGEEILHQLRIILNWWQNQRLYHIYSSSVLLTYDAQLLENGESSCSLKTNTSQHVNVLLIDFAHVVPANNTLDLNYINGLENFVEMLTLVVNEL